MHLILASQSAARAQLLQAAGFQFRQIVSGLRESQRPKGQPFEAWLMDLATQKALAVARRYPTAYIIGCDTGICFHGKLLGKVGTVRKAVRLLSLLAGKSHSISTAVCVLAPGASHGRANPLAHQIWTGVESTRVTLRALSRREIIYYVKTVKPFSCAGAYALQGGGAAIIRRIVGDPTTVVGLPMELLRRLLKQSGYQSEA